MKKYETESHRNSSKSLSVVLAIVLWSTVVMCNMAQVFN